MIFVTNARIPSITKSVRIRTIITKTTILLENYGIFRATDSSSWLYLLHSPGDLSSVWGCAYLNQPLQGHLHPPDHQPNLRWNEKQFCFCFVVDCTNLVLAVVWLWRWISTNRLASYFQSFRLSSTKPDIRSLFLLVIEPVRNRICH